jgi:isomerase DpgB
VVTGVADTSDRILRVDGTRPLSADSAAELGAVCDAAEDGEAHAFVIVRVAGVPGPDWADELPVGVVSKWERALRRLERIPAVTIAVADGDCGGPALDALLATDYRIMPAGAKLIVPVVAGATWPGMALYRLARQAAGTAAVRRAALFGSPVEAAAAQAIGIIDEVTDNAAVAIEKAMELAAAARGAELAIRRQLMQEALTTSYEDALGVHLAACDRALRRLAAGAP